MSRVCALILAVIGALFVYIALRPEVGQLSTSAYAFTVAFIAFVKAALFAAVDFVEE